MRNHTHAGNTHQLFGNVRRHDGDGALVGRDQFTDDFSGQALDERKRRLDTRAQEEIGNLFTHRCAVRTQHPVKFRQLGPLQRPSPQSGCQAPVGHHARLLLVQHGVLQACHVQDR